MKKDSEQEKEKVVSKKIIAKKDWELHHNDVKLSIKKGDEIKGVPEKLLVALRTEKVI